MKEKKEDWLRVMRNSSKVVALRKIQIISSLVRETERSELERKMVVVEEFLLFARIPSVPCM